MAAKTVICSTCGEEVNKEEAFTIGAVIKKGTKIAKQYAKQLKDIVCKTCAEKLAKGERV